MDPLLVSVTFGATVLFNSESMLCVFEFERPEKRREKLNRLYHRIVIFNLHN